MLYTIPKFKLNDLNKKLKRITNAGGIVNVEIKGEENVESTKTKGLYIPCTPYIAYVRHRLFYLKWT